MSSVAFWAQSIGSRVLALGALIFFHELGHYLAARWRGIHVEAFAIGFGPALLSWTDRHETVWKLCALPLGGFVKMHGMSVDVTAEQDASESEFREGQAFFQKSVLSRSIVVAAGPIANFVLAIVIFTGLNVIVGRQVPLAVVGEVVHASAADAAGLKPGDRILRADTTPIAVFDDLVRTVSANPGRTLTLAIHRGDADLTVPVTIRPAPGDPAKGQLGVAVSPRDIMTVRLGPIDALVAGVRETGAKMMLILGGLAQIVTTGHGLHDLGGPIAVMVVSGQVAKLGLATFISFVAFLSINLGLVNLLPIPILDGGHLMFYAAEALRGRPLPPRAVDYGYRIGFAIIGSLFLFISFNDLMRYVPVHWVTHLMG